MSHTHLTEFDRDIIAHSLSAGQSFRAIGRQLGRAPSTISREVKRNSVAGIYLANAAQHRAASRPRGRPRRKMDNPQIAAAVKKCLRENHSPDLISGRLKILSTPLFVGYQTIYNWIHRQRTKGRTWHRRLPRRGKPYRPRVAKKPVFAGQKSIHKRPEIVATRSRLGDWEGDTLEGRKGAKGVIVMAERRSRAVILKRVDSKSAEETARVFGEAFLWQRLPRKTLTVDRGSEFACGKELDRLFEEGVYAADPHSPWQKGTVEQSNGLLRRYLEKGFDNVTEKRLNEIQERLNHRPRKCLGYLTPAEVLFGISPP